MTRSNIVLRVRSLALALLAISASCLLLAPASADTGPHPQFHISVKWRTGVEIPNAYICSDGVGPPPWPQLPGIERHEVCRASKLPADLWFNEPPSYFRVFAPINEDETIRTDEGFTLPPGAKMYGPCRIGHRSGLDYQVSITIDENGTAECSVRRSWFLVPTRQLLRELPIALGTTLLIEVPLGLVLLCPLGRRKRVICGLCIMNVLTLPALWLMFPFGIAEFISLDFLSAFVREDIVIGELAVLAVEAVFLRRILKGEISWLRSFAVSFILNSASFFIPLLMSAST